MNASRALALFVVVAVAATTRFAGPTSGADAPAGPAIEDKLMKDAVSKARPTGAKVDVIMLHFSSDVVQNPDKPYDVDRLIKIYEDSTSSAHYLIDREGKIFRLVKEDRQAFHAGKGKLPWAPATEDKLNQTSIGIEMMAIGSKADMKAYMTAKAYDDYAKKYPANIGYTDKQYASLKALVADIRTRHAGVTQDRKHIVAHSDYAPDRRTDPGELFDWSKLGLKAKP